MRVCACMCTAVAHPGPSRRIWAILAPSGARWAHLATSGRPQMLLEASGTCCAPSGRPWLPLAAHSCILARCWKVLEYSVRLLRPLAASRCILTRCVAHGCARGASGCLWTPLEPSRCRLLMLIAPNARAKCPVRVQNTVETCQLPLEYFRTL